MARLENEIGLPCLEYRPRTAHGGGRAQAAVGFVSAVRRFCEKYGLPFDSSLWKGQEEPLTIPRTVAATATATIRVEAHVSKDIPYSFNNFFFHKCPAYDESCSRANLYRLTINSLSFGGMPIPLFDFL